MIDDNIDAAPATAAPSNLTSVSNDSPPIAFSMESRVEQINDWLLELIESYRDQQPRDADVLARRLGFHGDLPETLEKIGAHFDLSRERIRQIQNRAVTRITRYARRVGHPLIPLLKDLYDTADNDQVLAEQLATEADIHGADNSVKDLTAIKLAIAGYPSSDRRRLCDLTVRQLKVMRREERKRRQSPEYRATNRILRWIGGVDWPDPADRDNRPPDPAPTVAAREVDVDDEGRGVFYLDKVDRHVAYDSEFELRFLQLLDSSEVVSYFREQPCSIPYELDGVARSYYPDVVVQLIDGRVVLVEVKPLSQIAFYINQVKFAAARRYAHQRGWGWHIWTGGRIDTTELLSRSVSPVAEQLLSERLAHGPVRWRDILHIRQQTELDNTDLYSLVLRHGWRLDRDPYQLHRRP